MLASAQLIPVSYHPDSANWFRKLRHLPCPVWLDSGRPGSAYGRFDILSAAPAVRFSTEGETTYIKAGDMPEAVSGNPFQLLQTYLHIKTQPLAQVPFCGGLLGYFSYDLGRQLEKFPALAVQDIQLPDLNAGIYPWAIVQDHQTTSAWLVINRALAPEYDFSEINGICAGQLHTSKLTPEPESFRVKKFTANLPSADYTSAIKKIQAYIAAGDCYQVNFAQRFSSIYSGDTFAAYQTLRRALPSPFSAYMEWPQGAVLSLSPERFIKLEQSQAETKPIKGTIARGATPEEDAANARQLVESTKDRAENLMIVDLLRNDLSKCCESVAVPELFGLQSFANVHHLVSTVTGKLKADKSALDLLASCFPGGSITGAPKIRAMEIVEELEPVRRSLYCGSIGYLSSCGNMDTNIAIRTLLCDKGNIYCWGGGGIVADSEVDKEYCESLAKVQVLMDTLERHFGIE